jgi:RNA polymerase sigma-70 factor (ECF subfamily)
VSDASQTDHLLRLAGQGDQESWGALLTLHRDRLRCMVALRLDRRLQGRIDPSDVIQEAFVEATLHLPDYLRQPDMPFFLWLRAVLGQKMVDLHRHHLGTQRRDAAREVSLHAPGRLPEASSAALAARLLGREARPSEAAMRAERRLRLEQALNAMDPLDREVLVLRHFEMLNNAETARTLGLQESAASKRYVRALKRFKEILAVTLPDEDL